MHGDALARFHIDIISRVDGWMRDENRRVQPMTLKRSEVIIHDVKLLNAFT